MTRRIAALLVFLLPLAVSPRADGAVPPRADGAAAAAQVTLSASATTATIGERIDLRVIVRAEPGVTGIRVTFPPGAVSPRREGSCEVVGRRARPAVASAAGSTFEEIITIAFFQTGDFTIGPFTVELLPAGSGKTSEAAGPLAIHIRSLLGEDDKDIKALKGPLPLSGDPRHLLPYAAAPLLLLLLLAVLLLRRRQRRAKALAAEPPLAPDLELERDARQLRARGLWQAGEYRLFFIALSDLLKRFLERVYGFNVGECTTAETLAGLHARESDTGMIAGIEDVLAQSDLVKFACRVPAAEAEAGIWKNIAGLIAGQRQRRQLAEEAAHVPPGR